MAVGISSDDSAGAACGLSAVELPVEGVEEDDWVGAACPQPAALIRQVSARTKLKVRVGFLMLVEFLIKK
jgi:hypothetical protein